MSIIIGMSEDMKRREKAVINCLLYHLKVDSDKEGAVNYADLANGLRNILGWLVEDIREEIASE